jgi:4-amino-4-deoxy-L-arabinose transferase-like glycosyltransferase
MIQKASGASGPGKQPRPEIPPAIPPRRYALWLLVPVVVLACVQAAASWWLAGITGFTGPIAVSAGSTVRWSGAWQVPATGPYDLSLAAPDGSAWTIDGWSAARATPGTAAERRTLVLQAGFHDIAIEAPRVDGTPVAVPLWTRAGGVLQPLAADRVFPALPDHPRVAGMLLWLRSRLRLPLLVSLGAFLIASLFTLARFVRARLADRLSAAAWRRVALVVTVVLPALIVVYGAALRLEALTSSYGTVSSPAWLGALQEQTVGALHALHPPLVFWDAVPLSPHRNAPPSRYVSDPWTYLQFAREMRWFYAAHYREPLLPFLTRTALWFLDDQDVAVSFVSTGFAISTLLVVYLLGSLAFSRWVGLGAAAATAIEYHLISEDVAGGRDVAFTFAVATCAYVMLRYWRTPSTRNAVLIGLAASVACLVRITSLSFLVPGMAFLLVMTKRPWKERVKGLAIAFGIVALLVGPYLVSCWYVFGDPFYALNFHARGFQVTERMKVDGPPSAAAYVAGRLLARPYRTLHTLAAGMTSYPFSNKWDGFDRWVPGLGTWLSAAALAGLLLFAGSWPGRLLLLVLACSLVPFAATWQLAADWRFTQHTYPFFLIAAMFAIVEAIRWVGTGSAVRVFSAGARPSWRTVGGWAVLAGGVVVGIWMMQRTLPWLIARESLGLGDALTIAAGDDDRAFFVEGWYAPLTTGGPAVRIGDGNRSVVDLPLPRVDDYTMTLRLDPVPRPTGAAVSLPTVRVFVNQALVREIQLQWNPERVGAYEIDVRRSMLQAGSNRLVLTVAPAPADQSSGGKPVAPGLSDGSTFLLWYVRVRPPAAKAL